MKTLQEIAEDTHKVRPVVFRAPFLSKKRKYPLSKTKRGDWYERNLIGVDTETTIDFPKTLRTIQLYIAKKRVYILGTDEPECTKAGLELSEGAMSDELEVYTLDEVGQFLEIVPFLGQKLIFFNAPFDLGQLGFSKFRKGRVKVDMMLWEAHIKKLGTGNNFIKAMPKGKFEGYLLRLLPRWRNNPIVKRHFYREWHEIEERIHVTFSMYDHEKSAAYKSIRKHLWIKDFLLDASTMAAVFYNRVTLRTLCEILRIKHSKQDYDPTKELHQQIQNIVGHAFVTLECAKRILKILFYDMGLDLNPCRIVSPATITKFVLSKMNVRRPKLKISPIIGGKWSGATMLQNIMSAYYGGRVECKAKKREIEEVFPSDFTSLYPNIAHLQDCWRYMSAQDLSITRCTDRARHLFESITLESLKDPATWRDLNIVCHVYVGKDTGALLPVRVQKNTKQTIVTQAVVKDSVGWWMIQDLLASKIRGLKDLVIMEAFFYIPGEPQEVQPIELGNAQMGTDVVIDASKDDWFEKMLELRFKYDKGTYMYKLVKLVMNSAYGVTCERNPYEPRGKQKETYEIELMLNEYTVGEAATAMIEAENPIEETEMPLKSDKAGVYFNPLIGASITAGGRLCLAIGEALCPSLVYMDTDSFFVQSEQEMNDAIDFFKDTIPLKPERGGSFYCLSEKRYVLFKRHPDKDFPHNFEILSAKDHGLLNYVNLRGYISYKKYAHQEKKAHAIWRYILFNYEPKELTEILDEFAVRKCSLSSSHFLNSLQLRHHIKTTECHAGDFFYMSVASPKGETVVAGTYDGIQANSQKNKSKTIRDCLNKFMLHDSRKLINSERGFARFFNFEFRGIKVVNKQFSSIAAHAENTLLEISNKKVVLNRLDIPLHKYSSHKYGEVPNLGQQYHKRRLFVG